MGPVLLRPLHMLIHEVTYSIQLERVNVAVILQFRVSNEDGVIRGAYSYQ
jgi:hypothetical protein